MRRHKQQTGSVLMTVMLLLMIGMMLLSAQHRQLEALLLLVNQQQRYLQSYNHAVSALNWGAVQRWPPEKITKVRWYCQTEESEQLKACVRRFSRGNALMIRGEGSDAKGDSLWLYQLAMENVRAGRGMLTLKRGGWLDFCPETRERDCAE